jgi:dihydrofolate reductase
MRDLVVAAFVTLDGVMQAPGGPEEDPAGGFAHGGWSVGYWDDAMLAAMGAFFSRPFDLLLGRKTYEIFAAHWPYVGDDDPVGAALNSARKYVASRTLRTVDWHNSVLLAGDAVEAVTRLKAEDGPSLVTQGSSHLIQGLLSHGLVDEFRIWTFPVVVGPGKRLFADGTAPAGLELVDSATSATGVVMATYRPAGPIRAGSFAMEEPTDAEVERRRRMAAEDAAS